VAQAGQQGLIPDLVSPAQRGLAAGWKGLMDTGGATLGFVVLGGLLGGGRITPALLAVAAILVACYLLALLLVREPLSRSTGATFTPSPAHPVTPSFLSAFRLDLHRHRTFARVVLARFCFLLGTYAVGRFLLLYIADRLGLDPSRAAAEAGLLLAVLTLVTALAAPLGGWAADRLGRTPLMVTGSLLSAAGVLGLIAADSQPLILLGGIFMAFGSAAFGAANWALTTDLAPPDEAARFMAFANFGTAGGAAAAGLLGPLVDWGNQQADGQGYTLLFVAAALALLAAIPAVYRLDTPPMDTVQLSSRIDAAP
jgi:MFS family permease